MSGSLKKMTATDLAVASATPALERAGVSPEDIDHVVYGNVLQTANDAIYLPRHVGLRAGIPQSVPALGVNRLCGSGFQAIISAAEQILTGQADVVLCGGTEQMTQAPMVIHGMRDAARFGRPPKMQDLLWECLTDTFTGIPMAVTAENLADEHNIDREACDIFALESHQRWIKAQDAGRFEDELCAVEVPSRRGVKRFEVDEHPRRDISIESLQKLAPVFVRDTGRVTAGNASGIGDGAASLVVADAAWAEAKGLNPLARIVSWGVSGCDPKVMGIGPVPASQRALKAAGLSIADMALVEVNEAFAPQYLAVEKVLGLDRSITNVNGGAIAMSHPLGATGARIMTTLTHALRRRGERYGLGTACIGGGQGIAVVIEAL
jgi:acetyl-CoA acetyltransferase family protein